VLAPLQDADRFRPIGQVFNEVVMSPDGVVGFTLQPLWIQAVLERQRLLNAA
jgi:hypothetical protein